MGGGVVGMVIIVVVFFDGGARGTAADGEPARNIWGRGRARHAQWAGTATDGRTNGHGGGDGAMRGIETGLDEIFALGLCDKRLEFCGGKGVDKAGLGDHKEEDLGSGEGG